jgi:hypothetical protein
MTSCVLLRFALKKPRPMRTGRVSRARPAQQHSTRREARLRRAVPEEQNVHQHFFTHASPVKSRDAARHRARGRPSMPVLDPTISARRVASRVARHVVRRAIVQVPSRLGARADRFSGGSERRGSGPSPPALTRRPNKNDGRPDHHHQHGALRLGTRSRGTTGIGTGTPARRGASSGSLGGNEGCRHQHHRHSARNPRRERRRSQPAPPARAPQSHRIHAFARDGRVPWARSAEDGPRRVPASVPPRPCRACGASRPPLLRARAGAFARRGAGRVSKIPPVRNLRSPRDSSRERARVGAPQRAPSRSLLAFSGLLPRIFQALRFGRPWRARDRRPSRFCAERRRDSSEWRHFAGFALGVPATGAPHDSAPRGGATRQSGAISRASPLACPRPAQGSDGLRSPMSRTKKRTLRSTQCRRSARLRYSLSRSRAALSLRSRAAASAATRSAHG